MKKLITMIASALTFGAFAGSAADPVITADTSAVDPGTTCTVMAGDEEAFDFVTNGGDMTLELDEVYVGRRICLAVGGEEITDSTIAQMGAANSKLGAIKLAANVGDVYELSNADQFSAWANSWAPTTMTIPATEELKSGTEIAVTTIVLGIDSDGTAHPSTLTINGVTSATGVYDSTESMATSNGHNCRPATYTFDGLKVLVGKSYGVTCGAGGIRTALVAKNDTTTPISIFTTSSSNAYYPVASISGTVSALPAREAIDYACTVDGETLTWSDEPSEYMVGDTISYTGAGTATIPAGYEGATITIGGGVTLTTGATLTGNVTIDANGVLKMTSGSINQTQVTNNGKIVISGGTVENPVVINEDGPVHSSIERVEIAENSCVKMFAKGSGNRDYDVHGVSAATSTVILDSDHDWGITYTSERQGVIRNCKVIVKHAFWLEKNSMIDTSCDLQADAVIHLGWSNENATFEIGNLSGTGSIALTGSPKLIVNQTVDSNYTNFNLANLTVKANIGTVTLDDSFTGVVDLTGRTLSNGWNPASFGKTGSTVKLPAFNGHIAKVATIDTTLELTGDFTISNGYSPFTTTVTGIKGTGKFALTANVTTDYHFKFNSVDGEVTFEVGAKDSIILPASYESTVTGAVAKVADGDDFVDYCARIDEALAGKNPGDDVSNVTVLSESVTLPANWVTAGYTIDENGKIVKAATYPTDIEGGSTEQKSAYAAWATASGVSDPTTAGAAEAFALNLTADQLADKTVEQAVKDELDTLLKTIDADESIDLLAIMKAVTAGESTGVITIEGYDNATIKLVTASLGEGVTTDAKLFRLAVEFKPANSEE